MAIKGGLLFPRLAEQGKIKIGGKGEKTRSRSTGKEFFIPEKYDHFVITTNERDRDSKLKPDQEMMKKIGDHCTELDVWLLFDEIELNFPHWLALYEGKTCRCSGDGEKARERVIDKAMGAVTEIKEIDCVPNECPNFKKEHCKPHGVLSVVLKQMNSLGGVYKFRTGSWNSIQNLLGSMQMLRFSTGGVLAGIPLKLVIRPQIVQPEGQSKTKVVYTVNLEFRGKEGDKPVLEQLVDKAVDIMKMRQMSQMPMQMLVDQRKKELRGIEEVEVEHIADEFNPEVQQKIANGEIVDVAPKSQEPAQNQQLKEPIDVEIDKGFSLLKLPEGKQKAMRAAYSGNKEGLLKELHRMADERSK